MAGIPDSRLLKNITIENLAEYLVASGWENVESPKNSWLVYSGPDDFYGEPLEIVLSKKADTRTAYEYCASAVDLLASLRQESPDITATRIQNVDKDVLSVRNVDNLSKGSIPLKLAARQVSNLQTMVRQSANSERDALPHYSSNYYNSLADRMVNEFHFAHTQDRSFGLVIQSPILPSPTQYRQRELFTGELIEPDAPVARRIVERIVRGLVATKDAVRQESLTYLVEYYTSGFSSNMCRAIIDISRNRTASVEYSVLWSPKISPPQDIAELSPILLNETDYAYLSKAATQLKELNPDDTFTIRGQVVGLSSTDDPHKFGVGQSVVIDWGKPDIGRLVKIIVDLKPEEYLQAIQAHDSWLSVEVTGEAKLIGNRWRLLNPRGFRVIPKDD